MSALAAMGAALNLAGCAAGARHNSDPPQHAFVPPQVLVVAPVINLSNTAELDTAKLTDTLAAEFLAFRGVTVVPPNLTAAALSRRGKGRVDSPGEAQALAREFHADATIVTAVTHYDPYHPPRIGLVMQWYAAPRASEVLPAGGAGAETAQASAGVAPLLQVQRVFNAADEGLYDDVKDYADDRDEEEGPYDWKRYLRSQELFMRYCCWAAIRTMNRLHSGNSDAEEAGP